jgi:hypothetical protein
MNVAHQPRSFAKPKDAPTSDVAPACIIAEYRVRTMMFAAQALRPSALATFMK